MEKKGIQTKDCAAIASLMTEIFSNQRGADFMEKTITQAAENKLKADAAEKTRVDAGTAATVGDRSLNAAGVSVEKAYESFFTSAGKRLEPILLPLLNRLTDAINVTGKAVQPGAPRWIKLRQWAALANKFARIAWRLMVSGGVYDRPLVAVPA